MLNVEQNNSPWTPIEQDPSLGNLPGTPDPGGSAAAHIRASSVAVICGANSGAFQLAGNTISVSRNMLGMILNIDPDAESLVNGQNVPDEYVLQANDQLEFVKKAGEKGAIEPGASYACLL